MSTKLAKCSHIYHLVDVNNVQALKLNPHSEKFIPYRSKLSELLKLF